MKSAYLAASDIGHFEVSVQEIIECKGELLAGVVYADVEVQLLFSQ